MMKRYLYYKTYQNQHDDDAGDEAQRPADAAGDAARAFDVGTKELAHDENLPQRFSVASRAKVRQIDAVDFTNSSYVWASVLWGGIGGGYLIYGWRQKESSAARGRRGDDAGVFPAGAADDADPAGGN